jgi:hypothetical protein
MDVAMDRFSGDKAVGRDEHEELLGLSSMEFFIFIAISIFAAAFASPLS